MTDFGGAEMGEARDFRGRVAVITGAGGPNMGRAASLLFAAHGAKVCVSDINKDEGIQTVELIRAQGGEAFFQHTNVLKESSVAEVVAETVRRFGTVHYLCNFAGAYEPRHGTMETAAEDWDRIVGVTLKGTWLASKHAMRQMKNNSAPRKHDCRGVILCIASSVAHLGMRNLAAYTAANGGILSLTRAMAVDGAPYKIRVNCISPGITRTPATPIPDEETERRLATLGLLPYVGEPEDTAHMAVWLCSDHARFITGAIINIDGGWTAK